MGRTSQPLSIENSVEFHALDSVAQRDCVSSLQLASIAVFWWSTYFYNTNCFCPKTCFFFKGNTTKHEDPLCSIFFISNLSVVKCIRARNYSSKVSGARSPFPWRPHPFNDIYHQPWKLTRSPPLSGIIHQLICGGSYGKILPPESEGELIWWFYYVTN